MITTFTLAIVLGTYFADDINGYGGNFQVDLSAGCSSQNTGNCTYNQLIYRASFSLVVMYLALAFITVCSDYINRNAWVLKLTFALGLFTATWWCSNDFFNGWAETSRVLSFFWLLTQGILLLDFAHDLHEIIMTKADEAEVTYGESAGFQWYCLYLIISLAFLGAVGVVLTYVFLDYSGCSEGIFFVSITIIFGVLTTVVSLLDIVNKGLLTPTIMFAYISYMCWYSLLSSPGKIYSAAAVAAAAAADDDDDDDDDDTTSKNYYYNNLE